MLTLGVGIILVVHLLALGWMLRSRRWFDWPANRRPTLDAPIAMTAIVPARNEAEDIEGCLRSLLQQDVETLRVIAVNDHSTDATPQIIDGLADEDSRLTPLHDPTLTPGWLGKHNALHTALAQVETDLVVFTDADVTFAPECLRMAVAELEARQLDLLSLCPQIEYVTFCETMLLPIYMVAEVLYVSPAIENPRSARALAVGAFILVRTEKIRALGGYESIKDKILDDVNIARLFKRHGLPVGLRAAPDLMHVRLFKGNWHAFTGVTKHVLGIVQPRYWLAPLFATLPLTIYGTLLWGLIAGLLTGRSVLAGMALVTLVLHYAGILLLRPRARFSALKALAFPCAGVLFAVSCLHATYLLLVKRMFHWRGRATQVEDRPDDESRGVRH